jgi:hypothetical protein
MAVLADPSLPHQIRLLYAEGAIGLSCNCMSYPARPGKTEFIKILETGEDPWPAYNEHLKEVGE